MSKQGERWEMGSALINFVPSLEMSLLWKDKWTISQKRNKKYKIKAKNGQTKINSTITGHNNSRLFRIVLGESSSYLTVAIIALFFLSLHISWYQYPSEKTQNVQCECVMTLLKWREGTLVELLIPQDPVQNPLFAGQGYAELVNWSWELRASWCNLRLDPSWIK